MRDFIPTGSLREVLVPPTYGRHVTVSAEFTVLSVEIWSTGLVVNIQLASSGGPKPRIEVRDHFGTRYSLRDSATVGSRNMQVFSPSLPAGTRSLTIRSAEGADDRPVVTFAVPLRTVPPPEGGLDQPELRRPACPSRWDPHLPAPSWG